jgi:hypothetical protein
MPSAIQSIEAGLADRITTLKEEEARLTSALAALRGESRSATSNGATNGASKARTRATSKNTTQAAPGSMIERGVIMAVESGPQSAGQIRIALGLGDKDARRVANTLKRMVDGGLIKRQGARAGTRYVAA